MKAESGANPWVCLTHSHMSEHMLRHIYPKYQHELQRATYVLTTMSTSQFIQQFNIVQHQDPLSSLRRAEVTNHCTMVDILAFVVFTAPGSHTPPSDIQAGPLGHTGRPDIQSDLLSDSRASLTVSHQIQPIQPIQPPDSGAIRRRLNDQPIQPECSDPGVKVLPTSYCHPDSDVFLGETLFPTLAGETLSPSKL
jgi:hypothetical protein